MDQISLINNPYTQKLRILINGEEASTYSNLVKYMDEPFMSWCGEILDACYEECNREPFLLEFESRKEEMAVMEKLASEYPNCARFTIRKPERDDSLQIRMKTLNNIIRESGETRIHSSEISVIILVPDDMQDWIEDLKEIDVKNAFCNVSVDVKGYQEGSRIWDNYDVGILLHTSPSPQDTLNKLQITRGYSIYYSESGSGFIGINNGVYSYKAGEEQLFDTIFECLLLGPLMNSFIKCITFLPDNILRRYHTELEVIKSISYRVIPQVETNSIESGTSVRIKLINDITGKPVDEELIFKYSKEGIVNCDGMYIYGLHPGNTSLSIYKRGEMNPCAGVDFSVYSRNRITKLSLEEDYIYIGEGDAYKIGYSFLPEDADNIDSITWNSDNPNVATVGTDGTVEGKSRGECTIRMIADRVSTSCYCVVKPHLVSVESDYSELEMVCLDELDIPIRQYPDDCIDDEIVINSLDMQVVNVVNGRMKAVGPGTTTVVIQNVEATCRWDIVVHVYTEQEMKRLEKQREREEKKANRRRLFR